MGLDKKSLEILKQVDPKLMNVFVAAVKNSPVPFKVVEGRRTLERQKELFKAGKSKTMQSKHLIGKAVDVYPLPVDFNNLKAFIKLANHIKIVARQLKVDIVYGGDWESFRDYPHYELKG